MYSNTWANKEEFDAEVRTYTNEWDPLTLTGLLPNRPGQVWSNNANWVTDASKRGFWYSCIRDWDKVSQEYGEQGTGMGTPCRGLRDEKLKNLAFDNSTTLEGLVGDFAVIHEKFWAGEYERAELKKSEYKPLLKMSSKEVQEMYSKVKVALKDEWLTWVRERYAREIRRLGWVVLRNLIVRDVSLVG